MAAVSDTSLRTLYLASLSCLTFLRVCVLSICAFVCPGSEGLGFTVVTRDSSVHGTGPILVKNILTRGAAVKDGRLHSGDRILEVHPSLSLPPTMRRGAADIRAGEHWETVVLLLMLVSLQVNGVDITGVGQEELVCMLRSTRPGESVCLVVLRQEEMFLPREMVRTNRNASFSASETTFSGG